MTAMLLESAVEQGFIYALVALALYLSYRVLDIADLTTDGTFVLGSAVSAVFSAAAVKNMWLLLRLCVFLEVLCFFLLHSL